MEKVKLFFATNRKHKGKNRWAPQTYGTIFSSDGRENLRFGELELSFDKPTVDKYLSKKFKGNRIGDGENLSGYFSNRSKEATITAYKDDTAEEKISHENNSSTFLFRNLKDVMMKNADALIYIHGFNVSWDEAVGGALSLQFMLNSNRKKEDKEIVVVLFSWPSDGSSMPFAAYKSDRSDAEDAGKSMGRAILKLKDFLSTLHKDAKHKNEILCNNDIHLLCHSMGNYVLENALKSKVIDFNNGKVLPRIFKQVFLCAPDVNDDVLEKGNGLGQLHEMASHVTVYYNHGDIAMYTSKYTKSLTDRLGHVGSAHPAMVHNKIHQIDCSPIVHGFVEHSYYLWATVNKDIAQSISGLSLDDKDRNRTRLGQNREWIMV